MNPISKLGLVEFHNAKQKSRESKAMPAVSYKLLTEADSQANSKTEQDREEEKKEGNSSSSSS